MFYKYMKIFFITIFFVGCTSIPPEAPQLSQELGKKISSIESANIKLLNKFFDQKRAEVHRFINEEWIPVFANKMFSNPKIERVWNTIVRENNKEDRLKFLIKLGPKLLKEIDNKRVELLTPLNELERTIEKNIRAEYSQARAMNNSISSFLVSVVDVKKNKERYLNMVGITNDKIGKVIDQTDDIVNTLLSKAGDIQDKVKKSEKYIQKIKLLKSSI